MVDDPLSYLDVLRSDPSRREVGGEGYRFTVKVGTPNDVEAAKNGAKLSRGNFARVMSGSPVSGDYIKTEGKAGRMSARLTLQRGNIAPVDLAQAAIGPGMAVYTRYLKVLDAEGKPLPVREARALINQMLDEVLAAQEGDFDADTRWAITWFEEYGFALYTSCERKKRAADALARTRWSKAGRRSHGWRQRHSDSGAVLTHARPSPHSPNVLNLPRRGRFIEKAPARKPPKE